MGLAYVVDRHNRVDVSELLAARALKEPISAVRATQGPPSMLCIRICIRCVQDQAARPRAALPERCLVSLHRMLVVTHTGPGGSQLARFRARRPPPLPGAVLEYVRTPATNNSYDKQPIWPELASSWATTLPHEHGWASTLPHKAFNTVRETDDTAP